MSIADLTFVTRNADGTLNLWTPERPADYAAANAMGRDYAAELLAHIEATGDLAIFGAVLRAITQGGRWEAVEIGFGAALGMTLVGVVAASPAAREGVAA